VIVAFAVPHGGPVAAAPAQTALPDCRGQTRSTASVTTPSKAVLRMVLDERGWLVGHRLEVGGGASAQLSRGAFLDGPFGHRFVVGDRHGGQTDVRVLDGVRGCVESGIAVPGLVFSAAIDPAGEALVHDLVEPGTRRELGVWRRPLDHLDAATEVLPGIAADHPAAPVWVNRFAWGPSGELAAQSCGAAICTTRILDPTDASVTQLTSADQGVLMGLTASQLLVHDGRCHIAGCPMIGFSLDGRYLGSPTIGPDSQPVPESESDTWPDGDLRYRWGSDVPNDWMRSAISAAAADVETSRRSNAPTFSYSSGADDTIGLSNSMSGNCDRAIACATRDIPNWWYIRLRPHRAQLNWGTLLWCEAFSQPQGSCLEIERTMIHEFGHIEGLDHSDGLGLTWSESVMDPQIPNRPESGWNMHRFGPCDQATLQRRYDLPSSRTTLPLCGRVETALAFTATDVSIGYQDPVTFTATLRIRDRSSYGRLGGNELSGRAVRIERRPPGGSWYAFTPSEGSATGTYVLTFRPGATFEYRATFDAPGDDGVTSATSDNITVNVAPCTSSCPGAIPGSTTGGD